jgi:hypothetical protein
VKKRNKQIWIAIALVIYARSSAVFADDPDDASSRHGYCDIVFYCQTTKIVQVFPDGSLNAPPNVAVRFALKDSQLLVPEGRSLFGDGTANWKLTNGYCLKEKPKKLLNDYFNASFLEGRRYVKFSEGELQAADLDSDGVTTVWFAKCDRFD